MNTSLKLSAVTAVAAFIAAMPSISLRDEGIPRRPVSDPSITMIDQAIKKVLQEGGLICGKDNTVGAERKEKNWYIAYEKVSNGLLEMQHGYAILKGDKITDLIGSISGPDDDSDIGPENTGTIYELARRCGKLFPKLHR